MAVSTAPAQSINSGTVNGAVVDQSDAVIKAAKVVLRNPVTDYEQSTVTDDTGSFRFNDIPLNNYRLAATAAGFVGAAQDSPGNRAIQSEAPHGSIRRDSPSCGAATTAGE
jgi:hypothetical protein